MITATQQLESYMESFDVFEKLARYKAENSIPTWDQTLERIIPEPVEINEKELVLEGGLPS